MKYINEIKKRLGDYKPIIKEKFKIKEIGIFGSFGRGEESTKSDIDILVDFEKDVKTFGNYIELKYFLQKLLGLEVDLIMKSALKKELKDAILSEVLYV